MQGLEAFEYDLALHIHKENNVLFPRVFSAKEVLEQPAAVSYLQTNVATDSAERS